MILSEFAGAAQSLNGSIVVNPWDSQQVADAIHQAVTMPEETREENHKKLFKYIQKYSAAFWANSFVAELKKIGRELERAEKEREAEEEDEEEDIGTDVEGESFEGRGDGDNGGFNLKERAKAGVENVKAALAAKLAEPAPVPPPSGVSMAVAPVNGHGQNGFNGHGHVNGVNRSSL